MLSVITEDYTNGCIRRMVRGHACLHSWGHMIGVRSSGCIHNWLLVNEEHHNPDSLRTARMTCDVFAENAVHQGLPTFAGGFEIGDDLGAVAHRHEQLLVCGLGAATNRG